MLVTLPAPPENTVPFESLDNYRCFMYVTDTAAVYILSRKAEAFVNLTHVLQDTAYETKCTIAKNFEDSEYTESIRRAIEAGNKVHAFESMLSTDALNFITNNITKYKLF